MSRNSRGVLENNDDSGGTEGYLRLWNGSVVRKSRDGGNGLPGAVTCVGNVGEEYNKSDGLFT